MHPVPIVPDTIFIAVYDNNTDGVAVFDLTSVENQILAGFPTEGFEISFYTTEQAAQSGSPAISSLQAYTAANAIVYVRVTQVFTSCYGVGSIELAVLPQDYYTPQPSGEATQSYTTGQTLVNLDVEGQNIQWYSTAAGDTPISTDTLIEDGVTYYAAQFIYNVESEERLAVTAHLVLATLQNTMANLQYYPNPVKNMLTLSNTNDITNVTVYNTLGQQVLQIKRNNSEVNTDLSVLTNGVYFVKIQSGDGQKTIRIIKQ